MASNALVEHCLELLAPLGAATAGRMFGGHGLRVDGLFLALIADDRLYLKSNADTQSAFAAAGCTPFAFESRGKRVTTRYWTVPAEAMESPEAMLPWARLALQAALAARVTVPTRPRRAAVKKAARKVAAKALRPR
jgi:DNA transformation protein